jgi:SNF2 family DNA or RNA helicase
LVSQWEGEIRKFLGHQLRLVTLMTYSDLDACTVQRLQHSDIVLISQRLFESNIYQASLGMKATVSTGRVYVDRSYLDAVESLRGRMSTKLLLERFYWHRVIYDEVHELLSDSADAPWALPLRTLVAQHRWGITGTPPVHEASDVHRLGLLLRLHLGTSQPVLNSFVAGHIRTNTLSESVLPAPEEHFIPVTLSVEETALYQQAKYERAELLAAWNLKAYEEILQICSHFSLGRSSTGVASAGNVVATILKGKRERKEQLDSKVQKLQQQLSRVNDRIKVITEDNTLSVQQFQSQLAAEKGKREELKDQLELSKKELSVISSSLEFFDRTVSELQTGAVLPECPVCLTQLEWGQAVITTCSHIYCVPCISEVIRRHKKCATCRSPLDHGQWTVVTKDNMKDVKWNMVTEVPEEYNLYGTKIGLVVQTLKDIHKNDPKAKCLVYCQWDSLKNKVLEAFRKFGIGCLTLEGGPIQLRTVIDKFEAPSNTDDFVLMCSLQKKAAGTNLQCANHVLFVHPFFARSDEQCMAWEAQAIGRVQRYGQTKQVHIHRFVALHTIEQELLIESRSGGWKKYFQRFSEKCSRQLQPPNVDTEP